MFISFGLFFVGSAVLSIGGQQLYRSSLLGEAGDIDLDKKIAEQSVQTEAPKEEGIFIDPEGPAPNLQFEIQTEDKNTATLSISPDDPWKGNPEAKIAIIEFADFECGYCKRSSSELSRLFAA